MLGLSQASVDCCLPLCDLHPSHNILEFLEKLDDLYPPQQYLRLLAHPLKPDGNENTTSKTYRRQLNNHLDIVGLDEGVGDAAPSVSFHALRPPSSWAAEKQSFNKRVVLAVGPEGGWSDGEIQEMVARGFVKVHMLGGRVLRTDIAVGELCYQ